MMPGFTHFYMNFAFLKKIDEKPSKNFLRKVFVVSGWGHYWTVIATNHNPAMYPTAKITTIEAPNGRK